jgi:hypothetical protein
MIIAKAVVGVWVINELILSFDFADCAADAVVDNPELEYYHNRYMKADSYLHQTREIIRIITVIKTLR